MPRCELDRTIFRQGIAERLVKARVRHGADARAALAGVRTKFGRGTAPIRRASQLRLIERRQWVDSRPSPGPARAAKLRRYLTFLPWPWTGCSIEGCRRRLIRW